MNIYKLTEDYRIKEKSKTLTKINKNIYHVHSFYLYCGVQISMLEREKFELFLVIDIPKERKLRKLEQFHEVENPFFKKIFSNMIKKDIFLLKYN